MESNNPYRVSDSLLESVEGPVDVHHVTGARAVRERHINTEVSIQQIGRLYWVGGLASTGAAIVLALVGTASLIGRRSRSDDLAVVVVAVLVALVGGLHVLVGRRLQDLNPRGRIPATALAVFQLAFVPLGSAFGLLLLILLWSPQGRYVFTDEYASARALTPGMRPRARVGFWLLLLGVIIVVVGAGIAGMLLS